MQLVGLGDTFPNPIPNAPWINLLYELLLHRAVLAERVKQEAPQCRWNCYYLYITGYHIGM